MKIPQLIDFRIFILSLSIGLFFSYITSPPLEVIMVYPNPDNIDKLQYKDKSGTCHRFKANKVTCPTDKSLIRQYPISEKKNPS